MSSDHSIFVVDDDAKITAILRDYLTAAGYSVRVFHDGRSVVTAAKHEGPAAIILDMMLPASSGMKLCRELREFSTVPILMLTARIQEHDKIEALEAGADDYVTKPFGAKEVVARIASLIRRAEGQFSKPHSSNSYVIDEDGMRLGKGGKWLDLSPSEFRLLAILVRRPGRVFNREELLDCLGDHTAEATDRAIDSHIKNIRRKLKHVDPGNKLITSVYGVGYRFDG